MTIVRTTTLKEQLMPHLDQEDRGRVFRAIVGLGSMNGAGCLDVDVIALPIDLARMVTAVVKIDRLATEIEAYQVSEEVIEEMRTSFVPHYKPGSEESN